MKSTSSNGAVEKQNSQQGLNPLLMISGIIGIAIGDTLYINSLKIIGTRKTLSFEA